MSKKSKYIRALTLPKQPSVEMKVERHAAESSGFLCFKKKIVGGPS
jgi:hypothetical protein